MLLDIFFHQRDSTNSHRRHEAPMIHTLQLLYPRVDLTLHAADICRRICRHLSENFGSLLLLPAVFCIMARPRSISSTQPAGPVALIYWRHHSSDNGGSPPPPPHSPLPPALSLSLSDSGPHLILSLNVHHRPTRRSVSLNVSHLAAVLKAAQCIHQPKLWDLEENKLFICFNTINLWCRSNISFGGYWHRLLTYFFQLFRKKLFITWVRFIKLNAIFKHYNFYKWLRPFLHQKICSECRGSKILF